MSSQLRLTVVIFREEDTWVAQVLEHDMAAHGKTPYAALAAVQLVIQAHVNFDTRNQRVPLARLKRAPDVYWNAFKRAEPLQKPDLLPLLHPAVIEAAIANETISATTS
jgi:hypothetical protein